MDTLPTTNTDTFLCCTWEIKFHYALNVDGIKPQRRLACAATLLKDCSTITTEWFQHLHIYPNTEGQSTWQRRGNKLVSVAREHSANIFSANAGRSFNRNTEALLKFQKVFPKKLATSKVLESHKCACGCHLSWWWKICIQTCEWPFICTHVCVVSIVCIEMMKLVLNQLTVKWR